jgi:hypothetical protein
MLDRLTTADFAPPRPAAFVAPVLGGGPPLTLDLLEVKALRETPALAGRPARRAFSLLFRARTAGYIPQGTIVVEHDQHGRLEIFMVPVGRDEEGLLLEAIFT